jgi:hypothetical protein
VTVFDHLRVLLARPKSLKGEVCVITGAGNVVLRSVIV